MNAVRSKAKLSEKTVQKIAKGEVKKARKTPTSRRPRNSKVKRTCWSDDVDPRIVSTIKAMGVPFHLIEVVGPQEVIIHNHSQLKGVK